MKVKVVKGFLKPHMIHMHFIQSTILPSSSEEAFLSSWMFSPLGGPVSSNDCEILNSPKYVIINDIDNLVDVV